MLDPLQLARRSGVLEYLKEDAFGLCDDGFIDGFEQGEEFGEIGGVDCDFHVQGKRRAGVSGFGHRGWLMESSAKGM